MTTYDQERARRAVQYLVDSPYFHQHVRKLRSTVTKPRALPFRDDAEPLNELLVIGRQSAQALENLISVAEFKRDDRNDYQRQYMAAKRKRDRKVLLLEELLEGRKLPHEYRVKLLQRQYVTWNKERDQFIASLGDIAWAERNEMLRSFWERKESETDALIVEAKVKAPVIRKRKRVVVVKQEPKTGFAQKLAGALSRR